MGDGEINPLMMDGVIINLKITILDGKIMATINKIVMMDGEIINRI